MAHAYLTDQYEGMIAETITMRGHNGDVINAYVARPLGAGPFPGMVVIHHAPGWDEWYRECTRKFAHHGFVAISPNLYFRDGHGTPEDVGAKCARPAARRTCGCSGIWRARTPAALAPVRDAEDRRVRHVLGRPAGRPRREPAEGLRRRDRLLGRTRGHGQEELTPSQPVAPIEYTKDLSAPILRLFGNDDKAPTPEQVNTHEAELKKHGKQYEFHRYDGAGHGFFYYDRGAYRQEQAMDGWKKLFAFTDRTLR